MRDGVADIVMVLGVLHHGAVHAREGAGWHIEDCEVRLNSGSGIMSGRAAWCATATSSPDGRFGIVGNGKEYRIEDNHIWSNNRKPLDPAWEAGGAKIAVSDGVVRGNHVHDNKDLASGRYRCTI